MEKIKLPSDVEYIINSLTAQGYRADIVGGPVRDFLLGTAPDDYDITTSATPEQIKSVFANERTVDTGIRHGTVTLVKGGKSYEITTYRIDGEYKDSRHPESVCFTLNIEEDLARRDFTMNAIAYSCENGITDPYGGRADIARKVIRAVGDPDMRFTEDALRILRAVRFSSRLGFAIEEKTREAIFKKKHLLHNVSSERIFTEWKKLLSGSFAYEVISEYFPIVREFLPELQQLRLPSRVLFDRADYLVRFLSLFYLSTEKSSELYYEAAKRLKTDSKTRDLGRKVLDSVGTFDLTDEKGVAYALYCLGADVTRVLIRLEILLSHIDAGSEEKLDIFLKNAHPYRISDLKVGGEDLKALGITGKNIGKILNLLILGVIDGRVANERVELLRFAMEI